MNMYQKLSDRFRTFAESECKDSSPLYYTLSHAIAQDESMLDVAAQAAPGQPVPNLFFAAVHYMLSSDFSHPLRTFYPTYTDTPDSPSNLYPAFRDFVFRHRSEILDLLKSRLVQTNEVRRCAYLFPALAFAARYFGTRPLALIEIGTSAGLNLLWDRYRYSYGEAGVYGDVSSPVLVTSSFRGKPPSMLSAPPPSISHRIGLDLNIIDTSVPDQVDWLRSLVWPEHGERRSLLEAAIRMRNTMNLDLRVGDGFSMIDDLAEEIPPESVLCVYHTHVANQISKEARESFLKTIKTLGATREVIHVFNNIKPNLHFTGYHQGKVIDMPLATTDGHARWIEWIAEEEFQTSV